MAMVDKFVILQNVQFRKGGYENRYLLPSGEWVTKAIEHGLDDIKDKYYADGSKLVEVNINWIMAIKDTLGIKTEIVTDFPTSRMGTERLIEIITYYGGDTYVTNPEAKNKYLDEDLMRKNGIEIEYCQVPRHLQIHIFEAMNKFGIDGLMKQLPKRGNEIAAAIF